MQVIEKAYAKLHGSYDAIEAGSVSDGLVDMTAGIGSQFGLRGEKAQESIANGSLWARLRDLAADGHLLACGSHSGKDTDVSDLGIVQGHAYSILRVVELDGHRLLQVRNPWGSTEWKGRWSDADSKSWTQRMRKKLDFRDADDGSFWMAFEDFVVHFATVYVCRIMGDDWQSLSVRGEWKGVSAGGCSNYASNSDNPAYRVSVRRRLRLLLTRAEGCPWDGAGELLHCAPPLQGQGARRAPAQRLCRQRHLHQCPGDGSGVGAGARHRVLPCALDL